MARKPHDPIEPEVLPGKVPGHAITLVEEKQARDIESEMIFTAGKVASRIETALFYETVSQKVAVESYLELKKTKAWAAMTYRDADGKAKNISSLDEFCERYLKQSQRRVQQLADNYHTIGADLYETAEQIGFRQKDYAALKALPADDQEVIKQAMQPEVDRDQILDLMQELAVRHASAMAAQTSKTKEAEETAASRDTIIKNKQARLDQAEEENVKLKRRVETTTPDEAALEIRKEADRIAFLAEHGVRANLRKAFEALIQHGGVHQHSEYMLGLITQIEFACDVLRGDYGLLKARPDGDSTPHWERGPAQGGVN